MDATPYIARMRRILRDEITPERKGLWWADTFLKSALNAAQSVLYNIMLSQKQQALLGRLQEQITSAGGPLALPADYGHYVSARTESGGVERHARIYLGAAGDTYMHTKHEAAVILGNSVYFVAAGDWQGAGTLYYWRKPAPLLLPAEPGYSTVQDFDERVYDMICVLGASIAGRAETINKRDIYLQQFMRTQFGLEPARRVHFYDA